MRRLVAAAVAMTIAGGGLAGMHIGVGAVPGVSALHQVQRLLSCDAQAIGAVRTESASQAGAQTGAAGCTGAAKALVPGAIARP